MSRIDLNIVATGNFSQVETQLARLKAQAAALGSTISSMSVFGPRATADMQSSVRLFEDSLRSSGMFQTQMVNLRSETEKFGSSLQKGNIKLGESFRVASSHIRGQQSAISKLAREQVRLMNSTTVAMGDGRQMVITPRGIDEAINKQQILNQEYRIFRQVVANGSTQLINWGKNTQWAGRQLTVGLTVPLTIFGGVASKMFMDADRQLTRLAKVYGDASKGMTDASELDKIRGETLALAQDIAASMGVAVEQTIGIAADLAATGKEGNELLESTAEAMRLSVLGEVDRQEAMRATLSIQSVFNQNTKELADTINFLNAVENQTSTSLDDLTVGIVKAGPVVKGLGGEVKDLALMMVAMREGGIPASEAANAIKSSLASLINPTKQTQQLMKGFGIDLVEIVEKNAGNVTGTLMDLRDELGRLDDLSRQRSIEQIFGKFQFSRINALLSNIGRAGSQTEEVLKISGMSIQELAATAEKELSTLTESASMRFTRALEGLKANLIPIGEVFTNVGTMIINVANKILEIFNNLPEPVKNFINGLMLLTAVAGPIIMITGVLGNFFGYLIKGISSFMALKQAGRGVFEHFTPESIAARQASELLEQAVFDETKAINVLEAAIEKLNQTLSRMSGAANVAGDSMRQMAQETMAGAESAAAVATGGQSLISYATGATKGEIGGFGRSHLVPGIGRDTYPYGAQVGTTLVPLSVPGMSIAHQYQTVEGESFAPEFFDPSRGRSRQQTLFESATTASGRQLASGMSELAAQRLLPTREEYNKSVSEYLAKIRVLNSIPKEQTDALRKAISNQDVDSAKLELKRILDQHQAEYERFLLEESQEIQSLTGNMKEVTSGAIARELELTSKGPITTRKSGRGLAQLIYAESGGGIGLGPDLELDSVTRMRIEASKAVAESEKRLKATNEKMSRMSNQELLAINKDIKNREVSYGLRLKTARGEERFARIQGKWEQVTSKHIRTLDLSDTKQRNLALALEKRMIAERKLAVANSRLERLKTQEAMASQRAAQADLREADASVRAATADVKEAAASDIAAKADLAEAGASRRGRMGRLGRFGGAGLLGSLSMASMMIPAGEGDGALSTGLDILGGAGMGASMGMMAGPWGALAGAIIGGAIPAVNSFKDAQQAANDSIVKYAEAINGSSLVLDKFAKEAGALKPSEKLAAAIGQIAAPDKIMQEAEGLLQTDAGQELLNMAKSLGGDELVNTLRTQLKQLTLLEIFTPDQAKAVAQSLAIELNNPMLGRALVDGINQVIDSEGNLIEDGISKMFMETIPNIDIPKYDAEAFAQRYVDNMGLGDALRDSLLEENIFDPLVTSLGRLFGADVYTGNQMQKGLELYARETVPYLVSSLDKLREAQALTLSEFMKGSIGYEEYLSRMSDIREQNIAAADSLLELREKGADVTQLILDIARAGGREEEFKQIENVAKDIMGLLSLGNESTSRFYTQVQIAAAYGDITEGELSTILQMIQDPTQQSTIDAIFNIKGAEDSAIEIIKLLNMGMSADFIRNVSINAEEVGAPLNDIYASLVALSQLPENVQKDVQARITGDPDQLRNFISDYEYAMTLPDSRKELRAEVFGNEDLEFFQSNWQEFMSLPDTERKTAIFEYLVTGTYNFPDVTSAIPKAVQELSMPNLGGLLNTGGGGGGGSVDTSAIEEAFDKRIEQQDKIIEKIREEREERQKLLRLQEESLNFSLKEQGLKNQIARARAEGNLAEAALLQAQLDTERNLKRREEDERRRQEEEDRRIEEAEKAKKEIEEQKKEALDAARGSGGGGGGGGMSEAQQRQIETRIKFLNDELSAALTNNVQILDDIYERGARAFWDSEPIKRYIQEAQKLGIPLDEINRQLDDVYDQLVNQGFGDQGIKEFDKIKNSLKDVGLEGETLLDVLPNVFGIVRDTSLSEEDSINQIVEAFKDAGMSAEEAEDRAKKFFRIVGQRRRFRSIDKFEEDFAPIKKLLSKETGEKISKEFADGMRKGLTNREIMSNISSSLTRSIYDEGIAAGLDPVAAASRAEKMSESMLDRIERDVRAFNDSENSKVTFKGTYDNSSLPEWMRGGPSAGGATADRMAQYFEVRHTVTPSANTPGSSLSNPSYVHVKNWPTGSNNGGYSYPSSVTRASGGYISGPGTSTSDSIPAMLSDGEYVIRASSVDKYGINFLNAINMGYLPAAAMGGMISRYPSAARRMSGGGYIMNRYAMGGQVSGKMAEYNIQVNVEGTNASAEEIANTVMNTLKRKERMSGAVTRI